MSDKFNGFSQDEIKRVSSTKVIKPVTNAADNMKQAFRSHSGIRRMPDKWARTNDGLKKQHQLQQQPKVLQQKATATTAAMEKPMDEDTIDENDLERSMSKSIEEALFYMPKKKTPPPPSPTLTTSKVNFTKPLNGLMTKATTSSSEADSSSILPLNVDHHINSNNAADDSSILPEPKTKDVAPNAFVGGLNLDSPFKGISLKDFESHRKMIQEQNKQKKELLYKAIEHHSQKTAAETRKIEEIKAELSKLDSDLAVDVAILRKQIDNACVNFANIEKQYIKIEAQFLKAKLDLHNAAEKKELLTEHLCTVIAHNEDRKAQKLSELMHKVGLTTADEYECVSSTGNNEEQDDK